MADTTFLKDNLAGAVPSEISYNIIEEVMRGSSILKLATVEVMQSDNKTFSVANGGFSANWVGEAQRIGVSLATWKFPRMEARKLAVIVPVTREKLNDSAFDVFAELQSKIAEAFYQAIDSACLFGTASPFTTNIVSAATTAGNDVALGTNTKLDLDISDVLAEVEAAGFDATGFIADIAFKNSLRKLRNTINEPLYFEGSIDKNGNKYNTLYGLPITFNRNNAWDATKAVLIAGDWKYAVVGIRENIQYEILKEATLQGTLDADNKPLSLAEQDLVGIRAIMRVAFTTTRDDTFAVLTP